jgi:two-component system CheB/CheR fusion protein
MPDDLVHFPDKTAQPFVFRSNKAGLFAANSNPSVRELLSRNGELAAQNLKLTAALATQTSETAAMLDRLTPRQREVMALILAGHPSKNIAADLCISQRTVENHRAAIMHRTGATSLPALVRLSLGVS